MERVAKKVITFMLFQIAFYFVAFSSSSFGLMQRLQYLYKLPSRFIKNGKVCSYMKKIDFKFYSTQSNSVENLKINIPDKNTLQTAEVNVVPEDIFSIELPTNENNVNLLKIRHSTAHIMAMAVQKLHNNSKVTIGPWIDNG
jgi:hypothetical protein